MKGVLPTYDAGVSDIVCLSVYWEMCQLVLITISK